MLKKYFPIIFSTHEHQIDGGKINWDAKKMRELIITVIVALIVSIFT